jgi:hypothetical protein
MNNFESENALIGNIFFIPKFPNHVVYSHVFTGPTDDFTDFAISSVQNFLQSLSDNKVSSEKFYILTIDIMPAKLHPKKEWMDMMSNVFSGLKCSVNFNIDLDNKHSINLIFSSNFTETVFNFHRDVPEYER